MKKALVILGLFSISLVYGQEDKKYTNEEINLKLDSIMIEANLLYQYEHAAWLSTDLANKTKDINKNFGGFLTYKLNDVTKTIIYNKEKTKCIAEYILKNDSGIKIGFKLNPSGTFNSYFLSESCANISSFIFCK